jgi:heme oxygenase (biliverdin-producing, ferredoxin)
MEGCLFEWPTTSHKYHSFPESTSHGNVIDNSHVHARTKHYHVASLVLDHCEKMIAGGKKKSGESPSCPYAIALHSDDDSESESGTSKLIQSCPAFQQGSCPFASCADEDAVRKQLLQIPPSHYESGKGGPEFLRVLQELHAVASLPIASDKKFQLSACPVASKIPINIHKSPSNGLNFIQAIEGFSLAAIMARMAEEMEKSDDEMHDSLENATPTPLETNRHSGNERDYADSSANGKATMRRSSSHVRLSESFKHGTAASHQAAEDVHFVRNFIRGQIDRKLYAELVVQLFHVYDGLEGCLVEASPRNSSLQKFCEFHEKLRRKETLVEDLDFWHGPVVTKQIISQGKGMSPAARDYVERLKHCSDSDPILLLAHSYTRYLGDLSGGKILARVARKAMNLDKTNKEGLAFYEFAEIPSAKSFKDEFRSALDDLDLTTDDIARLVEEANVAFLLNMRLFEELDVAANVPGASVRPLQEALNFSKQQKAESAGQVQEESKQCPFATLGSAASKEVVGASARVTNAPAECPFANAASNQTVPLKKKGRCPWPFILAHDPVAAMKDWRTWALAGLILCFLWSKLQQHGN